LAKITEKWVKVEEGIKLYTKTSFLNSTAQWLIVTHGVAEHSGRYDFIFDLFENKFNILIYDLRGHGKSDGKRGSINSFNEYRGDLEKLIKKNFKDSENCEYILFGHSMGGLIIADFVQHIYSSKNKIPKPVKLFLSSPAVRPGGPGELAAQYLPLSLFNRIGNLKIGLNLSNLFNVKELSHDIRTGMKYMEDSLVLKSLNTKLICNLVARSREVFTSELRFPQNYCCVVGSKDQVVSPTAICNYAKRIDSHMKVKLIEGARHELHNEIPRFQNLYFEYLKKALL
jgi:alpha-beta hydrolase superfamily lysophospholipase